MNFFPSFLYFFLIESSLFLTCFSLSFVVEPRTQECFFEDYPPEAETFNLKFEVISGGLLDIELYIYQLQAQQRSLVYNKKLFFNSEDHLKNNLEGNVNFPITKNKNSKTFEVCFNNEMSRWTSKTVYLKASKDAVISGNTITEAPKLDNLGPLVDSIIMLSDYLDSIKSLQHSLRVREAVHRDTQESTNSRVQSMTLIESILLISLAGIQLWYIRQWFSVGGGSRSRV